MNSALPLVRSFSSPAAGAERQRDGCRPGAAATRPAHRPSRVRGEPCSGLTGREHYPLAERDGVKRRGGPGRPRSPPRPRSPTNSARGRLRRERGARRARARPGRASARRPAWRRSARPRRGPTSKDSNGRSSAPARAPAWRVTSAIPEWPADSGSAPQAAASAATIPNASGNVLGITCASQAGSRSGRSSCSSRPVKCTRSAAAGAAAQPVAPGARRGTRSGTSARPAGRPPARARAPRSRAGRRGRAAAGASTKRPSASR